MFLFYYLFEMEKDTHWEYKRTTKLLMDFSEKMIYLDLYSYIIKKH